MVTILSNVNALAASRQLGVSKIGLQTAITRLTTGRRVNTAMDDATGLARGNTAQATARSSAAAVIADQVSYFSAVAQDSGAQQATQDAYRLAELEGGGNGAGNAEYDALVGALNGGTLLSDGSVVGAYSGGTSSTILASIAAAQQTNATNMSTSLSAGQVHGATAEAQQGIADAYLGADMGAEMANLTKYQILMSAGTSALNNANQAAQSVLSLFR